MNAVGHLAEDFFEDFSDPIASGVLSVPYASGWFSRNHGSLNLMLDTSFCVEDGNFDPPIGEAEKAIYKEMFLGVLHGKSIRNAATIGLDQSEINFWTRIEEGDTKITRSSPNETIRYLSSLKKESSERLNDLVRAYRRNVSSPKQILP